MIKLSSFPRTHLRLFNFQKIVMKAHFLCCDAQYPGKTEAFLPRNPRLCWDLVQNSIIFLKVPSEFGTITALAWPSG
jgi:hypothetical protein